MGGKRGSSSSGPSDPSPGDPNGGGGGGSPGGDPSDDPSSSEPFRRYPLEGLYLRWDDDPAIRDRLRDGGHLMQHWDSKSKSAKNMFVEKLVENLRLNARVLSPLFRIMSNYERAQPVLDNLMQQISLLFDRSKVKFTLHGDRIYQEACAIRRLCALAKAQVFRKGPPKDKGV